MHSLYLLILSMQVFSIFGVPYGENRQILDRSFFDYSNHENGDSDVGNTGGDPELDDSLFEGDLEIPYELYKEFYLDGTDEGAEEEEEDGVRRKRGAIIDTHLWPNGHVYYRFDQSEKLGLDKTTRIEIREIMDEFEQLSCLRFVNAPNDHEVSDFIGLLTFQKSTSSCSSTSVGRYRAKDRGTYTEQYIKLRKTCSRGTKIHEIGHAIGFWHEHTRPDRNDYVEIIHENIRPGKEHNFFRRDKSEVDSRGSGYDYGSIMHYRENSFSIDRPNLNTIELTNNEEYERQGRPEVGQRKKLSIRDIEQMNAMYNCSNPKYVSGLLEVDIAVGTGLPLDALSYVSVTAFSRDVSGNEVATTLPTGSLSTSDAGITVWNEQLVFGLNKWMFFRIQIQTADENLTLSETVPIAADDVNTVRFHCEEPQVCNTNVEYQYTVRCPQNCENGGTCEYAESSMSFKCMCTSDFEGDRCQYRLGRLRFHAERGKKLRHRGWWVFDSPDPYIQVEAIDQYGYKKTLRTKHKWNTANPKWNQDLDFGIGAWKEIRVRVFDFDRKSADDALSNRERYAIVRPEIIHNAVMKTYRKGEVTFSYSFAISKIN